MSSSSDLEAIVRTIFNSAPKKDDLSVKAIRNQVSEKIGREVTKPESQHIKDFICELYQNYAAQNVKLNLSRQYLLMSIDSFLTFKRRRKKMKAASIRKIKYQRINHR